MIPKDDFTVTINADDSEYVDLCAINPSLGLVISTEHGFGTEVEDAVWIGQAIEGQLKVSASNATQCAKDIWISPVIDKDRKFVYFSRPKDWPHQIYHTFSSQTWPLLHQYQS